MKKVKIILVSLFLISLLALPLQAATLEEFTTFIEENFTQIDGENVFDTAIRLLTRYKELNPQRETEEIITKASGKNGRTSQVYELRYVDTGELISKRTESTTYYGTGEINMVTQKRFDKNSKLVNERKIKYYKDGRQPKTTKDNQR